MLGAKPVPAGILYFPARVPILSHPSRVSDEEVLKDRNKNWERKGLLLLDEEVLRAMESEGALYRMPYNYRKDGTVSGHVADANQFGMLRTYVFAYLRKLVNEIASGCVDPNPYTRGDKHNACTFCPYGTVCHEYTVEGRRDYATISAEKFWEDVEKAVKENG